MPVHIEEMTSDVTVMGGELPLSQPQIEKLVQVVLARLDEKQRDRRQFREATTLRRAAAPPLQFEQ